MRKYNFAAFLANDFVEMFTIVNNCNTETMDDERVTGERLWVRSEGFPFSVLISGFILIQIHSAPLDKRAVRSHSTACDDVTFRSPKEYVNL